MQTTKRLSGSLPTDTKEYRKTALEGLHDNAGHLAVEKTLSLVKDRFFWPKMAKDVETYVKSCEQCIKRKTPATHPLQFVTMDHLTIEKAMGYKNILVIIDHLPSLHKHIQERIKRQLQQPHWY